MRGLLIAACLVLFLLFVLTAVPLLSGAKALVFAIGVGKTSYAARVATIAIGACAVFSVLAAILFGAGRMYSKKYYQLLGWRDLSLTASVVAALVAAGAYIWRHLAHGVL
ncbi:MAG TPA: hypothetical protein VN878_00045 [Usitatibacter sp.]|nr:hypothetical protein [Usitatibacter sp.]